MSDTMYMQNVPIRELHIVYVYNGANALCSCLYLYLLGNRKSLCSYGVSLCISTTLQDKSHIQDMFCCLLLIFFCFVFLIVFTYIFLVCSHFNFCLLFSWCMCVCVCVGEMDNMKLEE